MENNKGITLIALAITIIVLLIIASVGTYSGVEALRDAKEEAQISELNMVKQPVVENYTKYLTTKNNMYIRGTKLNYSDVQAIISEINNSANETVSLKVNDYDTSGSSDITGYYYRLSDSDLKKMGVTQAQDSYIVNYKTGEVINETLKATRTGVPLYTYSIDATT